jgi:hypothetical protein
MKYLVVGHKFGELGRGGYHISKRFCKEHSEYCEFREDTRARKLEELNEQYKKIIFRTQVPRCYNHPLNFVKLRNINYIFYLRAEYLNSIYKNCTNGFYYYKMYGRFDNYVPMITDFPSTIPFEEEECFGFYVRNWLTPDSFGCFLEILDSLKRKVKVATMGDFSMKIKNHKNVSKYTHTNNNIEFFSQITHYFYPTSKRFIDPFPHSLLEAFQSGRNIIIPKIDRSFNDGIDDLKDVIHWHEKYRPNMYPQNNNTFLTSKSWKKFYENIFSNDWKFSFDRNKYKTFYDFIEGEVI